MANFAKRASQSAAANGFTKVISRGKGHLITQNPKTGKYSFDTQVNARWHYGTDNLECDSAWEAGAAPWEYQMVKADFNLFARSNFSKEQIIKWLDPASKQYVEFTPMALQWTNDLDQIQQIAIPQSVEVQVSDNSLYWPAAYGLGRDFRYLASSSRLNKQLILDSAACLPTTSYDQLELNFIISISCGVNIIVDGETWNKKTTVDSVNSIIFQLPGGDVLWSFASPMACDSSTDLETRSVSGSIKLQKYKNNIHCSIRFPKSFFDRAVYPVYVDPSIDYQVSVTGSNDGYWRSNGSSFNTNATYGIRGYYDWYRSNIFARFPSVTIPDGADIISAYVSIMDWEIAAVTAPNTVYFTKQASPGAISSNSDGENRVRTTASASFPVPETTMVWTNSEDLSTIISELMASYSYANGAAMQVIVIGHEGTNQYEHVASYSYEQSGHLSGLKLHIEYSTGPAATIHTPIISSAGNIMPSIIGSYIVRGR